MAQPPKSGDQEDRVDGGGGQDHRRGPPQGRESVGENSEIAAWQDGQRHQKSLEQHHEEEVRDGGREVHHWDTRFALIFMSFDAPTRFVTLPFI